MAKITWADKITLNPQPSIARENKCTNDDLNEIKQVVNTNDDIVNGLITSSSDYIKLDDGTLICYGTTDNITFVAQNDGRTTINLPVAFKDTNYSVQLTLHSSFPFFTYIHLMTYTRATNSVEIGGFNENTNQLTGQLDYIIIGRWK